MPQHHRYPPPDDPGWGQPSPHRRPQQQWTHQPARKHQPLTVPRGLAVGAIVVAFVIGLAAGSLGGEPDTDPAAAPVTAVTAEPAAATPGSCLRALDLADAGRATPGRGEYWHVAEDCRSKAAEPPAPATGGQAAPAAPEPADQAPAPAADPGQPAAGGDPAPAAPAPEPAPAPAAPAPASTPLAEQIATLPVAAENGAGYDREAFGDYDRDALLAESLAAHGCYQSAADGQCYASDDAVEVDHIVALAEAWASGASGWSAGQLDQFGGDPANLWLMTASLNSSKSDEDAAEWLPPADGAVCGYVTTYVQVKASYHLSVDQAERDALVAAAAGC